MRIILSLGSLLDTDVKRSIAKFFAYGVLNQDNQAHVIQAVGPIIEKYKRSGNSAEFEQTMKKTLTQFGINLHALEEREPNWLKECWNAMLVLQEQRFTQIRELLADKSNVLYLYSNTNPWHFEMIGKEKLCALGIEEKRIVISYETENDPFEQSLAACIKECEAGEALIYLTDDRPYPEVHTPDKIRHENYLQLLAKNSFKICPWPQEYKEELSTLIDNNLRALSSSMVFASASLVDASKAPEHPPHSNDL